MKTFVERLENLTLLSQCERTADAFTTEYEAMLAEVTGELQALKTLCVIQMEWLERQAEQEAGSLKYN